MEKINFFTVVFYLENILVKFILIFGLKNNKFYKNWS